MPTDHQLIATKLTNLLRVEPQTYYNYFTFQHKRQPIRKRAIACIATLCTACNAALSTGFLETLISQRALSCIV